MKKFVKIIWKIYELFEKMFNLALSNKNQKNYTFGHLLIFISFRDPKPTVIKQVRKSVHTPHDALISGKAVTIAPDSDANEGERRYNVNIVIVQIYLHEPDLTSFSSNSLPPVGFQKYAKGRKAITTCRCRYRALAHSFVGGAWPLSAHISMVDKFTKMCPPPCLSFGLHCSKNGHAASQLRLYDLRVEESQSPCVECSSYRLSIIWPFRFRRTGSP